MREPLSVSSAITIVSNHPTKQLNYKTRRKHRNFGQNLEATDWRQQETRCSKQLAIRAVVVVAISTLVARFAEPASCLDSLQSTHSHQYSVNNQSSLTVRRSSCTNCGPAEVAGNSKLGAGPAGRRHERSPRLPVEPIDEPPQPVGRQQQPPSPSPSPSHRTSTAIKNVTAQNGQNVLLHCVVEPSGEQSNPVAVSWFRGTGELQLLTYEGQTIIQDDRFVVRHGLIRDNDWALQIRNLDRSSDSGLYQCQTNSDPPQSQYYQLNVLEPQVHILGAPDMAVKPGAPISLSCVISQTSTEQPQFVFWFRDGKTINYELADRGKIVISKSPNRPDSFSSNLQIFHSKLHDSGNYTCMPSGARPVSIQVHVLEGLDNRRLIMFQNDANDDQRTLSSSSSPFSFSSSSAASSFQQANSAANALARNFKTTEGRLYALVVASSIFANWTHLLAQIPTGITLLLLSIIGYLIGLVTDQHEQRHQLRRLSRQDELEPTKAPVAIVRSPTNSRATSQPKSDSKGGPDHAEQQDYANEDDTESSSGANTSDPLLDRANSALNLLKSLHSAGSNTASDDNGGSESDCAFESSPMRRLNRSHGRHQAQKRRRLEAAKKEAARRRDQSEASAQPASPSSSSSSSGSVSASTGYNSDITTRTCSFEASKEGAGQCCHEPQQMAATATCCPAGSAPRSGPTRLTREASKCDHPYGDRLAREPGPLTAGPNDGPMIELVSQPTALSVLMDELSSGGRPSQITCSPSPLLQRPSCKRHSEAESSIKMRGSPSSSSSSSAGNNTNSSEPESHYSLPAAKATATTTTTTAAAAATGNDINIRSSHPRHSLL